MTTGIYKTTDPNKRVRIVFDDNPPYEDPKYPYAEGVLEVLQECYEEGNSYGAILLERNQKTPYQIAWGVLGDNAIQPNDRRGGNAIASLIEQAIHLDRLQRGEAWEETDSIWGCAGYDDPAVEIAKEYFNVEITEKV